MTTLLSAHIQLKNAEREVMRQQQAEFFKSGGEITCLDISGKADLQHLKKLNTRQRKHLAKSGIKHVNR